MTLAKLALDHSRITICGLAIIVLVGVTTFLTYPRAEDPTITIRTASITASFPGMSPDRVEELITKPLESAMREIAEIDDIESTSKTGATKLSIDIHDYVTDLDPIFQEIRNKADDVKADLPEGTLGPIVNDDEGLTAVATIALWADGFSLAEMRDVARDVRDLLYTLEGVRKIDILGVQEERIYLEATSARLAQLGVSPQQVFGALAQQNIIELGGEIVADGRTLLPEPSGNLESVEQIRDVVFRIPGTDRVLRLGEVLDVRRILVDPPEFPAFYNDRPAIVLAVSTVAGVNNVEFGNRLTAMVDDIAMDLPVGYVLDYATFQPELIAIAVEGVVSNVYQTLGIVLVVVMLFLGWRTGLIVGSFVPLTMLLGIIVIRFAGVELQRMSIAATIIALGMLVDNGIVVAEDIRVRLERGTERLRAAAESGRTLAIPLLTSSLTTIFAFVPMLLVPGGTGEFVRSLILFGGALFYGLASVIAFGLLVATVLTLGFVPVLYTLLFRVPTKDAWPAVRAAPRAIQPV